MKDKFLLNPNVHHLNHGSFGACPKEVFAEYQRYQLLLENEPVQFMMKTGVDLLDKSKQALANYINCQKEDLIYVTNPSTAMNIVIKSLQLKEGDEILSTNHEYGAMDRTWRYYCHKSGAKYVQQTISTPLVSKEEFLKEFWSGLTANTRIVFVSQITSPTALIFPVKEICERAKELGLITIIDGAHVPAQIPLDLTSLKADYYTGACHKWLCAPKGSSFLYASKEVQNELDPLIISWGYEADVPSESQFQDYHQYQGTRDFSAFLTTAACIQFQIENNWAEEIKKCRQQLQHYYPIVANELNSMVLCPISDEFLGQICSFPINTSSPLELKDVLYQKYKIEIPVFNNVGNTIYTRLSFMPYNSEKEIEIFINAIRDIKATTSLLN
jgi:isopenicillin-N epimerase